MTPRKQLADNATTPERVDEIIAAYVNQREDARLRARWYGLLNKKTEAPLSSSSNTKWIAITAMVVLFCALLYILAGKYLEPATPLVLDNAIAQLELVTTRSGGANPIDQARARFAIVAKHDDPAATLQSAQELRDHPAANDTDRINVAKVYLQLNRPQLALPTLRQLHPAGPSGHGEVDYLVALALLQSGATEAGLQQLNELPPNTPPRYLKRAQKLLRAAW